MKSRRVLFHRSAETLCGQFDLLAYFIVNVLMHICNLTGQRGLSHVNNKALVDVVAQMNKRGFDINKKAGEPLRNATTLWWLKDNVHVYHRTNKETFVPEDV